LTRVNLGLNEFQQLLKRLTILDEPEFERETGLEPATFSLEG